MTKHSDRGSLFQSVKFTDWPTVKEALIAKEIGASFILAPMAMQLRADGVPIKVVYLGHRDGTTLMVHKDSPIQEFGDLRGKKVAVPSRFANQNILIHKMMKTWNMPAGSIDIKELPPPEHPTALLAGSIDAYIVGEPFAAKSELDGHGRVLYYTKDIWPNFISCVLVVHEDLIKKDRRLVQELVDGIAKSGKWVDESLEHRMDAAEIAAKYYYFQKPELLKHVLSKPADRVRYTQLSPLKRDFDEIMELAVEMGVLKKRIEFEEYADPSFVRPLDELDWELAKLPAPVEGEQPGMSAPPKKKPAPATPVTPAQTATSTRTAQPSQPASAPAEASKPAPEGAQKGGPSP
ncbi:ABC transporter substrate-binding protein [Myxococcota bacterium]|nr:ABC transporter substrate-binding protein [Myxococcota bacterium]